MVTIKQKWLIVAAYLTLALPICVFILGWTKILIAIPSVLIMAAGLIWLFQKDWRHEDKAARLPVGHFVGIIAFFMVIVALSGMCHIGVSDYDIPWRNAIFHDLVTYDWPVTYSNGAALTYYVTFWMIPALFGKLFGLAVGYAALYVFIVFILTLVFLLTVCILGFETPGKIWLIALFLILWSGVHYLAAAFMTGMGWSLYDYGILTDGLSYMDAFFNGEGFNWFYRSNSNVFSQTYNQLMIWVVVVTMLSKRSPRGYMALGLLLLPYSPWGFIGLIPLLIAFALPAFVECAKKSGAIEVVKQIFSPANICVTVVVVVIFGTYFLSSAASGGVSSAAISADEVEAAIAAGVPYTTQTGSFGLLSFDHMSIKTLASWIIFVLFEFVLFAIFLFKDYKKNILFWTIMVELAVVPFIWAGSVDGRDFCMNASIPGIFILMIFMLSYLDKHVCGKPLHLPELLLVILLCFSLCGPVFSYWDKASMLIKQRTVAIIDDSIGTFEGSEKGTNDNFLKYDYKEAPFFKYLSK